MSENETLSTLLSTTAAFPTTFAYIGAFITIFQGIIGILSSGIVLVSNYGKPNSESAKILFSLCLNDFIFTFTMVCYSTGNVIAGGFRWGLAGCYLNTVLLLFTASNSICTLGAAALKRYLAVCKGVIMTNKQVFKMVLAIWTYSMFFALIPLLSGQPMESIALEPTHSTCVSRWWGRNWASLVSSFGAMAIFGFSYVALTYSYVSVYKAFVSTRT